MLSRLTVKRMLFLKANGSFGGGGAGGKKTTGAGLPAQITGTREEQAATFERIDKTYERPGYIKNVNITINGSSASIDYRDNEFSGIASYVNFPSGRRATPSEIEGAIKWRMYRDRPQMEQRIHNLYSEFPTVEMAERYRGRALTASQRKEVFNEANRLVKARMGSGISKEGRDLINSEWTADNRRG